MFAYFQVSGANEGDQGLETLLVNLLAEEFELPIHCQEDISVLPVSVAVSPTPCFHLENLLGEIFFNFKQAYGFQKWSSITNTN